MAIRLFLLASLAALLLASCQTADPIKEYRAHNRPCPKTDLSVPCKLGPDGLLYRY